jgi:3',5'-cyclic AMP phosphodiesterase CpdA
VKFYASLGNHDEQNNRFYKPWNMNGERYYTYTKKNVRFFVLDSDYIDPKQLDWVTQQLKDSTDDWKIAYFHHPLYSSAGRHGSETDLRLVLEPLFVKYGVNVVFSGHDHVYERVKPQKGNLLLRVGVGGPAAEGRPAEVGAHRCRLRSGPDIHAGRDRQGHDVGAGALTAWPYDRHRHNRTADEEGASAYRRAPVNCRLLPSSQQPELAF